MLMLTIYDEFSGSPEKSSTVVNQSSGIPENSSSGEDWNTINMKVLIDARR